MGRTVAARHSKHRSGRAWTPTSIGSVRRTMARSQSLPRNARRGRATSSMVGPMQISRSCAAAGFPPRRADEEGGVEAAPTKVRQVDVGAVVRREIRVDGRADAEARASTIACRSMAHPIGRVADEDDDVDAGPCGESEGAGADGFGFGDLGRDDHRGAPTGGERKAPVERFRPMRTVAAPSAPMRSIGTEGPVAPGARLPGGARARRPRFGGRRGPVSGAHAFGQGEGADGAVVRDPLRPGGAQTRIRRRGPRRAEASPRRPRINRGGRRRGEGGARRPP